MSEPLPRRALALAILSVLSFSAPVTHAAADAGTQRRDVELPQVEVVGDATAQREQPGSAAVIEQEELERSRTLTVSEALRKVPGLNVRDEEGFGLRPNIGIRGLNPTRSTKVLLLEDGIPAAYAPYGDNASYYHAPLDRYARVEVLKGVGMLRFGPQTIGGVINYITPAPPEEFSGYAQLAAGNRGWSNVHVNIGGGGFLFDAMRREGDAARENQNLKQADLNLKYVARIGDDQGITFRLSRLTEDSQVTYSGLTEAEYANFGREYNPFRNDVFDIERYGGSITHEIGLNGATLTTNLYGFRFDRDWWRQSSTNTDTQCGTAFRDARLRGERVDVEACNSAQGRLRYYETWGIEPRLFFSHEAFGIAQDFEAGVRWHDEMQDRRQVNATSPRGRVGTLAEDNLRETEAFAAFVENRFRFGSFILAPVVRWESIDYVRENRLNGARGESEVDEVVPGLGANWAINDDLTVFAGVHEGFAPPRAEDLIDNSGGGVEVDAERSTNWELGVRGALGARTSFEAALFRNDFRNQIAVGSIAGGSTPLAEGETTYAGAELLLNWDGKDLVASGRPYANLALTALPTARQDAPLTAVATGLPVGGSATGKRLPYAPRWTATARVGWQQGAWDVSAEVQSVSEQFSDFANTQSPVASGQGGVVAGWAVWNLTVNWIPSDRGWSAFAALKNAGDRDYIVDRTRGILTGSPRQFVAGMRYAF
ncbi:MAG: TonB-dependent receptor [Xanthomonadaceae bacterium]|nr:TonB-dependent receptor [Xanthomonadaceae bacterium]